MKKFGLKMQWSASLRLSKAQSNLCFIDFIQVFYELVPTDVAVLCKGVCRRPSSGRGWSHVITPVVGGHPGTQRNAAEGNMDAYVF